jgi:Cys-tRNA(Pro)/Cys-tRNA(Cys) deacylase
MLPSHHYLNQLGIPYQTASFPASLEKGAANVAHYFNFTERQMVKTLIFVLDTGECILVMVGADQNVISGNLKKAAGSRNIQMADPELVKRVTGYEIGSIPPFSWQATDFRSFLDAALLHQPVLGVGAGVWGNEIFIKPYDLVKASAAQVINLTDRQQPIFVEGNHGL